MTGHGGFSQITCRNYNRYVGNSLQRAISDDKLTSNMLQRYLRSLRELEEEQRLITSQILGGNSITSAPDALSAVSLELGQVRQDLAALKAWVKNLQWDE